MRAVLLAAVVLASTFLADAIVAEDRPNISSALVQTALSNTATARTEQAGAQRLAQDFVEQINAARIALALKDAHAASTHLQQSENALRAMKSPIADTASPARIGSGKLTYENSHGNSYYFPVEVDAGPLAMKRMTTGSIWNSDGIAVTDAEIVYLTLDLRDQKASNLIAAAKEALRDKNMTGAQQSLSTLMTDTVRVETAVSVPIDKARDNLALTRAFIQARNYDGARYALKHADEALSQLEKDPRYAARRGAVSDMRSEVIKLNQTIERRDPSLLSKADETLDHWWIDMKEWAQK